MTVQKVWREFNIENMHQYPDRYLNLDVLMLADVFENIRQTCILDYGLDSAHYYTLMYSIRLTNGKPKFTAKCVSC